MKCSAQTHDERDKRPPVTEPVFVATIFATEIVAAEEIGDCVRLTFAEARPAIGLQPAERIVVAHVLIARAALGWFLSGEAECLQHGHA